MNVRPLVRDDLMGTVEASRKTPADRRTPRRAPVTHGHASVAFYTGGRARVEQNGEWKLGEGDVLLIPAGERHRMLELRRAEYWGLALWVPSFADRSLFEPLERVRDGTSAVVHVPSARQAFLEALFRELHEVGVRGSDTVQRSLVTLIFAEIERASGCASRPVGGVVAESLRFIERNCLRPLSLDEIAAAVGRSPTYVTAALTKATGSSAGAWIVRGRMAEGRRLLLSSDERVEIIAERVGYADVTHFIRMFRRAHGATPAAWRAAAVRGRDRTRV